MPQTQCIPPSVSVPSTCLNASLGQWDPTLMRPRTTLTFNGVRVSRKRHCHGDTLQCHFANSQLAVRNAKITKEQQDMHATLLHLFLPLFNSLSGIFCHLPSFLTHHTLIFIIPMSGGILHPELGAQDCLERAGTSYLARSNARKGLIK